MDSPTVSQDFPDKGEETLAEIGRSYNVSSWRFLELLPAIM
jgi:hypothetical protein